MVFGQTVRDVIIHIRGDTKELDTSLKEANTELKGFRKGITDSYGELMMWGGGAAVGAAMLIKSMADSAMQVEQLERGFHSLAQSQGKDAELYLRNLKIMSHGTMSEAEIMRKANQAMLLGIDLDTINKMMEGSAVIAQATGQDVGYMFESLALGVGRQSRMLLDNLGIIVRVEEANQAYADSLGKAVSELTDAEQKTAFLNAAMDGLAERTEALGGFYDNAASSASEFSAQLEDLKATMGETLLPPMTAGLSTLNDAIWVATEGKQRLKKLTDDENRSLKEQELLNNLLKFQSNEAFRAAIEAFDQQQLQIRNQYEILDSWDKLNRSAAAYKQNQKDITTELQKQTSELDKQRAREENIRNAKASMYSRRSSMSADTARILGIKNARIDPTISGGRSGL